MFPSTPHSPDSTRLTSKTTPHTPEKSGFFSRPRLIPTLLFFHSFSQNSHFSRPIFLLIPHLIRHFKFFPPSLCSILGTLRLVSPLLLVREVFCPSRLVLHTSPDMFVSCDSLSQARGVLFHNSVSTQFLIYAAAQFLIICSLASSVGRASAF